MLAWHGAKKDDGPRRGGRGGRAPASSLDARWADAKRKLALQRPPSSPPRSKRLKVSAKPPSTSLDALDLSVLHRLSGEGGPAIDVDDASARGGEEAVDAMELDEKSDDADDADDAGPAAPPPSPTLVPTKRPRDELVAIAALAEAAAIEASPSPPRLEAPRRVAARVSPASTPGTQAPTWESGLPDLDDVDLGPTPFAFGTAATADAPPAGVGGGPATVAAFARVAGSLVAAAVDEAARDLDREFFSRSFPPAGADSDADSEDALPRLDIDELMALRHGPPHANEALSPPNAAPARARARGGFSEGFFKLDDDSCVPSPTAVFDAESADGVAAGLFSASRVAREDRGVLRHLLQADDAIGGGRPLGFEVPSGFLHIEEEIFLVD